MISEHKEYAISNVIKQCQSMGELSAVMLPQQKTKRGSTRIKAKNEKTNLNGNRQHDGSLHRINTKSNNNTETAFPLPMGPPLTAHKRESMDTVNGHGHASQCEGAGGVAF